MSDAPDIAVIAKEIAGDDSAAEEFLRTFYDLCHCLDDWIDRDKAVPQDVGCAIFLRFFQVLVYNPFFLKHKDVLMALIHSSVATYIHSNELAAREGLQDKLISEVLKSEYQAVFFYVAFLTGGWRHQMEMQRKYRRYCFG